MKTNKSNPTTPSRWNRILDHLAVTTATGSWSVDGPRGWEIDHPTLQLLAAFGRGERKTNAAPERPAPAVWAGCFPSPVCCAG